MSARIRLRSLARPIGGSTRQVLPLGRLGGRAQNWRERESFLLIHGGPLSQCWRGMCCLVDWTVWWRSQGRGEAHLGTRTDERDVPVEGSEPED